ncbi:hypothetical protein QUB80_21100 [Chlorogloeopsis sp. ULAP01]|uniref:hypothetical protein n=1 Tax=Chlorogloeopsis sp. ULAP01 TaxID=3056483 RepID=UPI0025AA7496|nr:hypothetical protein [Chlorogloeopsis sp. ULAP01]MDM9383195.1 hypothetical protein [Chlorogloeopsis sp. ULAP01]
MTTNTHFNAKVNNGKIEIPVEYQDEIRNAEMVQITILKPTSKKKGFPQTGIIAQLTANPIQVAGFKPLTREEANERW